MQAAAARAVVAGSHLGPLPPRPRYPLHATARHLKPEADQQRPVTIPKSWDE